MPFDKHRGVPVSEVPADYLVWCLENMDSLRPHMRTVILAELRRRGIPYDLKPHEPCPTCGRIEKCGSNATAVSARSAFDHMFRQLALLLHPDRGGSVEAMRILNATREKFLKDIQ